MDIDNTCNNGSYFASWYNKKISNLGSFDTALFELYLKADGTNRAKLVEAFPRHFLPKSERVVVITDLKPVIVGSFRWYYDIPSGKLYMDKNGKEEVNMSILTNDEKKELFDFLFQSGWLQA